MSRKNRTLEIDEDLNFQRREWSLQRVGIGILFLFVMAACSASPVWEAL